MHASQIIDNQADLVDRIDDEVFQRILLGTFEAGQPAGVKGDVVQMLHNHVTAAYAYRVAGDMTSLVVHAAKGLDADDRIDASLAPTGCGIVRFDRPLPVRDVRGTVVKVHWITWGPGVVDENSAFGRRKVPATYLSMWNDIDDPDDTTRTLQASDAWPKVSPHLGRWGFIDIGIMREGSSLGPSEVTPSPSYAAAVAGDSTTPVAFSNINRYVHALWLLLGQTIVTVDEEHVRKTSQKLAQRKNLPGRVSVVDLRRSEGGARPAGESAVEWTRRWVVRGHWRWQAVGEGRAQRRRIWINPFVKGPDGAPFEVPDKVYDLRR